MRQKICWQRPIHFTNHSFPLHDVIPYANERNVPLAVISVDQMKAFNRVSHPFLFKTLQKFGFGPNFTQWIRPIYTSVSSSVKTNGWLSAFIQLERGLRQGCPLSMPLYVLTAETMAINIRSNPIIHGIKQPGSQAETKLSQFADDTTLLLTDEQSITIFVYNRTISSRKLSDMSTVKSRFLEASVSRSFRYLEPNLVFIEFVSLRIYISNMRLLEPVLAPVGQIHSY